MGTLHVAVQVGETGETRDMEEEEGGHLVIGWELSPLALLSFSTFALFNALPLTNIQDRLASTESSEPLPRKMKI